MGSEIIVWKLFTTRLDLVIVSKQYKWSREIGDYEKVKPNDEIMEIPNTASVLSREPGCIQCFWLST